METKTVQITLERISEVRVLFIINYIMAKYQKYFDMNKGFCYLATVAIVTWEKPFFLVTALNILLYEKSLTHIKEHSDTISQ